MDVVWRGMVFLFVEKFKNKSTTALFEVKIWGGAGNSSR